MLLLDFLNMWNTVKTPVLLFFPLILTLVSVLGQFPLTIFPFKGCIFLLLGVPGNFCLSARHFGLYLAGFWIFLSS